MVTDAAVHVLIPTPLRRFTAGEAKVVSTGATVNELLDNLDAGYPGLGERLRDDDGQIRRFVNIFVNGSNIRELQGADSPLHAGDEVGIIPAMAGGH
ncbi:MAG: MoaD/ThiS family protein [Chloroflexota bacterium]|nr:MoaD/ThiS family protein [Chloroflexota bacterium]